MLYGLARPLLFLLDPETAHELTLPSVRLLQRLGFPGLPGKAIPGTHVKVMGIEFPNPLGLAAGLDKHGEFIDAVAAFGFGFLEVGGVTPLPQPGNPRPRVFRIPEREAIINRLGFNSVGIDRFVENVRRARYDGILGVNLGKNKDTPLERTADDYIACLEKVYPLATYATVNVSSPNTKNLRQLQQAGELGAILAQVTKARDRLARIHKRRMPLAVKIAPDLDDEQIAAIAAALVEFGIDAVIATNTTISRAGVKGLPHGDEEGGLSGGPLRAPSTAVVRKLAAALKGRVPIVGSGGIMTVADAREKLDAGATLLQLYTGLVYRGPGLVREIVEGLAAPAARAA
jgi:dihydroorotate dehydrogenase